VHESGKVAGPSAPASFTPKETPLVLISVRGRVGQKNKILGRTRELPVCSAGPQTFAPTRDPNPIK